MKALKKIFQLIYCIYALIIFAVLTTLSAIALIILLPFGKAKLSKRIYKVCRYWAKTWYIFIGVSHQEIYEAKHDFKKPHIFIANHNSYMDIPPIVQLKHQPIRPLGKFESSKIPIFGWVYRAAVIMVDRTSPEKRAKSLRNLKAALYKRNSIFIFPEGTFSMTSQKPLKSFFNGAFKLAIEMQITIQPILMIDAVDRMHFDSVFSLTPGPNRVVYLETIQVTEYSLEDVEVLKNKVHAIMDAGLRKYRSYPKD
jgi:1-acyl-sn-glycerol-3-phosphate acyltransferase